MKGHSDGRAAWDGGVIGPDDVGLPRAEGARRLRWDHIFRVFQADPEEYVTVSVSPADALRRVVWVDFQLKHTGWQHLKYQRTVFDLVLVEYNYKHEL